MNQTITNDRAEWDERRAARYSDPNEFATNINMLQLPLPGPLAVKGYALMPVIQDEDGEILACKTRALSDNDSLMNYDFSQCYILDYFMNIGELPSLNTETFEVEPDKPWYFTSGRMVRYAGEAVEK